MNKINPNYGKIFMPVGFRSTKHFTINTPLGYTGAYNSGIGTDRNFVVIDKIDNFINSGYVYSADYQDAYLDISHEELPVSKSAIVLISEDKVNEIMRDEEIKKQLTERKVIIYRGDESLAINMVLSEMGALPSRPGNRYYEYDPQIEEILKKSMSNLCEMSNIDYAQNHGNLNGVGGHFSDLFDQKNMERSQFEDEFVRFLQNYFPQYVDIISLNNPEEMIHTIGPDRIQEAINHYNDLARKNVSVTRNLYDRDHTMISDEDRRLFQDTIQLIRNQYKDGARPNLDSNLQKDIITFFQSIDIQEQVDAAKRIQIELKEINFQM